MYTTINSEMTNKEIKTLCTEAQAFYSDGTYPDWKFRVEQTKKEIRIYWEYINDYLSEPTPFKIKAADLLDDGRITYWAYDEHGEMINEDLEHQDTIEDIIKSVVYYMTSRY